MTSSGTTPNRGLRAVSNVTLGRRLVEEVHRLYEAKGVLLDEPQSYSLLPAVVFARVTGQDGTEVAAGYALFQYDADILVANGAMVVRIACGEFLALDLKDWKQTSGYVLELRSDGIVSVIERGA